jgi:hypothetical protein
MPKFQVTETFVLEARSWFVLAGSIAEGVIKPGMLVGIPFNSVVSMTAPIEAVEFRLRPGGAEDTCLCIRYADEEELSLWQGLSIGEETLDVTDVSTAAASPGAA